MPRPRSIETTRSVVDVTDARGEVTAYRWSTYYDGPHGQRLRKAGKVSVAPILKRMGARGTHEKARREAEKRAWAELEAFVGKGPIQKKEEWTTVERWCEYCVASIYPLEGQKPRSIDEAAKALRRHVYPQLGNVPLAALTPMACIAWYGWLRSTSHPREYRDKNGEVTKILAMPMSVKTAANVLGYFAAAMERAHAMNQMSYSPVKGVPKNRQERREHKDAVREAKLFLSSEEARSLRTAARGTSVYGLVLCGLDLGTRIAEANGLLFEHLRLEQGEHGVAYVQNQVQRYKKTGEDKTRLHDGSPKSLAGYRPLLLSAELRAEIDRRLSAIARGEMPTSRYVFANSLGKPHSYSTIREGFLRACEKAGIALPPRNATHVCRRYFTNVAKGSGVNEDVRAQVAGHERYETTMLSYEDVDQASYRRLFSHVHRASYGAAEAEPQDVAA